MAEGKGEEQKPDIHNLALLSHFEDQHFGDVRKSPTKEDGLGASPRYDLVRPNFVYQPVWLSEPKSTEVATWDQYVGDFGQISAQAVWSFFTAELQGRFLKGPPQHQPDMGAYIAGTRSWLDAKRGEARDRAKENEDHKETVELKKKLGEYGQALDQMYSEVAWNTERSRYVVPMLLDAERRQLEDGLELREPRVSLRNAGFVG